jgi:hypothetical protein
MYYPNSARSIIKKRPPFFVDTYHSRQLTKPYGFSGLEMVRHFAYAVSKTSPLPLNKKFQPLIPSPDQTPLRMIRTHLPSQNIPVHFDSSPKCRPICSDGDCQMDSSRFGYFGGEKWHLIHGKTGALLTLDLPLTVKSSIWWCWNKIIIFFYECRSHLATWKVSDSSLNHLERF